MSGSGLGHLSMLELFRLEAESQAQVLTSSLLTLERDFAAADALESCMRAAHSLKGAARIVGVGGGVEVAHAMEDCFVAAQQGRIRLRQPQIDALLRGVDLLDRIAHTPEAEIGRWDGAGRDETQAFLSSLSTAMAAAEADGSETPPAVVPLASPPLEERRVDDDRVLRVTAESLNRVLGLSGESLVASRSLNSFARALKRMKPMQLGLRAALDRLGASLAATEPGAPGAAAMEEARHRMRESQEFMSQRLGELEVLDRRCTDLSRRLYEEALACRMRPFGDGVQAFPRMVRNLARTLGKEAVLEIVGEATPADREVMERLDAPLGHLLRNALDHGIEPPEGRRAAGKPPLGKVRLEARHTAGMLHIEVSDDGGGISLDKVRRAVVRRQLGSESTAAALSEEELLQFLFLPGFTMKESVSDVSGRGVGLDVVQDRVKQLGGSVSISSRLGAGTRFELLLPLTLSVVRALVVSIGGAPYAFPLSRIVRAAKAPKADVEVLEGRRHLDVGGRRVGLVSAQQLLGGGTADADADFLSLVVIGDDARAYALVVERFIGERELVVQPLDPRLGKVRDIAAGALAEDGSPVLIVDCDDLLRSVDKLVATGRLSKDSPAAMASSAEGRKRILVVEDSLTVRELERKLLANAGYDVEAAVDGMDGWNALRTGRFDLVITDIDMPRMDGIKLLTLIRKDPALKSVPVMIVSYKDREEDRLRGLEAGADHYIAKGSFHDDALVKAVADLIGEAAA